MARRVVSRKATSPAAQLPEPFAGWFQCRGWSPRDHQLALLDIVSGGQSALLIAPTGAGKTLAGFLPSLVRLSARGLRKRADLKGAGLDTLYLSPLKALAADIARNLEAPIAEMQLKIRTETRTGDTSLARRQRQRSAPPDILMTTPEQLSLLLSHADAGYLFADLRTVVLDELHALAGSKRGDLLSLDLARLRTLAPEVAMIGLSATVARPSELRAYLVGQSEPETRIDLAQLVVAQGGARPRIRIVTADQPPPWSGHSARYAIPDVLEQIARHKLSLVFVNTRMQAELVFQELWRLNEKGLRIALHHGSLDAAQRRKVEAAMAAGTLDAVVATSTLDLGLDWGDVDLVIHVGAPKGASRLLQRIGRSNHRLDEPSEAILVPANRFEVLECRAAEQAAEAGEQDVVLSRSGALDVLAQHVLGTACAGPFLPDRLFGEVRSAAPYSALRRETFDRTIDFVSTGGYALRSYERFAKLVATDDGRLRLAHPRLAHTWRLNAGTIIDNPMIRIRLVGARSLARLKSVKPGEAPALMGGRVLGEVDEYFIEQLVPGDTFVLAGEVVRFAGMRDMEAFVTRSGDPEARIPSYNGGKFPLSTHLAGRVRAMLADRDSWRGLPEPVREWLQLQAEHSALPARDEVLIETFPRSGRHFLVAYPFEGRLAHQTLGMLLTRRLDRARMMPMGFVATDYALAIWCRSDLSAALAKGGLGMPELFEEDMLGDDLDAWLAESSLMKRTFRHAAVISGLIEQRHPGQQKSGRQVTISTDLVYDVLRRHDPGHILLEAAWADAATGLLDIARLGCFLKRIRGRIRHQSLPRISPLAVPVLLEIGIERVGGGIGDQLLRESAEAMLREAAEEGDDAQAQVRAAQR
jgi:ATP-dependent Lhr-like helicase